MFLLVVTYIKGSCKYAPDEELVFWVAKRKVSIKLSVS